MWSYAREEACAAKTTEAGIAARWVVVGLLGAALLAHSRQVAGADVTVTVNPWGAPTVMEFDPTKNPGPPADPAKPGDLPGPPVDKNGDPLIPSGEDAVTVPNLDQTFKFTDLKASDGKVKLTGISVTVSGNSTIYLPTGAGADLKAHEMGHDALCKDEYNLSAMTKITAALTGLIGKTYASEAAAKGAIEEAKEKHGDGAVVQQMNVLNEKFDTLTNHGTSTKVNSNQGVQMAIQERNKAPAPGQAPAHPAPNGPTTGSSKDPACVSYDATTGQLSFGGNLGLSFTGNPLDPLIGRGVFAIQPTIVVGPIFNGTILLADTELTITDALTGGTFLDGFVFQMAYMPSTLPGYAGMIQGYLDIPPSFAGGIDNAIGSDFLAGMRAASDSGQQTTFWFYSVRPLFDARGTPLIDDTGSPGTLILGVAERGFIRQPTRPPKPPTTRPRNGRNTTRRS